MTPSTESPTSSFATDEAADDAAAGGAAVRLFDAPEGHPRSPDYSVTVNGQPAFVHTARASARAVGEWWPGKQRPLDETELTSFVHFDLHGTAEVQVTYHHDILRWVTVKPERHGVSARIEKRAHNIGVFSLTIDKPGVYVCEIDTIHYPIYIIANPPEAAAPDPADPNVLFFGPGIHRPGKITLESGQHLYIAGGAVVHGYVEAVDASDIRISGRGILDAGPFDRNKAAPGAPHHEQLFPRGPYLLHLQGCEKVHVDGIFIIDAPFWTFVLTRCSHVLIDNVKVIGGWRYNSDGIDVVNCNDVLIQNSFIRAYDDCICLKGREETSGYPTDFANCENITARNCVLWNDWGVAIKIGTETMAREIANVLFEDIDILYYCDQPFAIQCGDFAHIHDITLRDIRIGDAIDYHLRPSFIMMNIYDRDPRTRQFIKYYANGRESKSAATGIERVRFERITNNSHGRLPIVLNGFSAENGIRDISFHDVRLLRFPEANLADLIHCNAFAETPTVDRA